MKCVKNKPLDLENIQMLTQELRKYFFAQTTLLKAVYDVTLISPVEDTKVLLGSSCSTASAIYKLGNQPEYFYSEMIMLSRSLIEKLVNFTYLQVSTDYERKKFFLHPFYREFHNSDKSKYTAEKKISIKFTGRDSMKSDSRVQEALNIFSETNHTKDWSNLNIDKKISVISKNTKIRTEFFLMNTVSIYSNASEALHGSLYGCALATCAFTPGINHKNINDVNMNLFKSTALLYVQLGSMVNEVIVFLANKNEVELEEIQKASKKNEENCLSVMKKLFNQ